MINFTVGPVQMHEEIRKIGYEQVPYFRTEEFSKLMLENEKLIKKFTYAVENDRVVFITGSGTASMEATIMNIFNSNDKVLAINGGSFGQRFVDLLKLHEIDFDEIKLDYGKNLTREELYKYNPSEYTGLVINIHETSTGVHYDLDLISEFCKENNLILVVDAISSFLADDINFDKSKIDVLITGSQKALACPPGVSVIVLSERAVNIVNNNNPKTMYLDLKSALKNGERGQTPFTPAVGILIQINKRLNEIEKNGGLENEKNKIAEIALDFRNKIKELPFEIVSDSLSNAVTPLHPLNTSANDIFLTLKNEYNIWVCPNGGELKDKVFRVGHIGALTKEDNDLLINALKDMKKRNLI